MTPPGSPKIYHITHLDNLASIATDGLLLSDAAMIARGGPSTTIGMSSIKQRRLSLPVACHRGDCVGDYVPFYFCPRSVMLFMLHWANHPDLTYRGGQGPIVHLEADLQEVVAWADSIGRRWAFTLSNAGAVYCEFRSSLDDLDQLNWNEVAATDWRASEIKEAKQAEFLLHGSFPWQLVERIGVHSVSIEARVDTAMQGAGHRPGIEINPNWYY